MYLWKNRQGIRRLSTLNKQTPRIVCPQKKLRNQPNTCFFLSTQHSHNRFTPRACRSSISCIVRPCSKTTRSKSAAYSLFSSPQITIRSDLSQNHNHNHNRIMNKVFKLPSADPSSSSQNNNTESYETLVERACQFLARPKGVIAIPTETIYGVAADASSPEALERIYQIKGRDPNKPIALCLSTTADISKYSQPTISEELINQLLPGPFTLCFERTENLQKNFNPNASLVGIRIPRFSFILDVTKKFGPLALTSANRSNEKSSLCIQDFDKIWNELEGIFDGGEIDSSRSGSTVVDLSKKGFYKIIRQGEGFELLTKKLADNGIKPQD